MNAPINAQTLNNLQANHSTLAEKAVLIRLKIGAMRRTKKDDNMTSYVEHAVAREDVGAFNKKLMPKSMRLKLVDELKSQLYSYHKDATRPWLDDGMRVLPSTKYLKYMDDMSKYIDAYRDVVKDLADNWQYELSQFHHALGQLFDVANYPSASELQDILYVDLQVLPLPTVTDDFRAMVDQQAVDSLNDALKQAEQIGRQHILASLMAPLRAMVEKLGTEIGKEGAVFRNSLMTNLTEMAARMRDLHIENDHELDDMLDRIEQFADRADKSADMCRTNATTRNQIKQEADELASALAGLF